MNNCQEYWTRETIEKEIIKKAQAEKKFRMELIDNPQKAITEMGVQLPKNVEVKVVEESAKVVYLVLPVHPDELADEQLEDIAGGNTTCGSYVYGMCTQNYAPGGVGCSGWWCRYGSCLVGNEHPGW